MNNTSQSLYCLSADDARKTFPLWCGEESEPREKKDLPRKHQWEIERERMIKRYGLTVAVTFIWGASMIVGCCVTGTIVHNNTVKEEAEHYAPYLEELTRYKQKEWDEGAQFFLSGEASKAAAMQDDAIALAHDGGMWKTEMAFKTYCWNVVVRKNSPFYPNSITEVLDQKNQYDFHDHGDYFSEEKYMWAMEVLEQAETGMMPAYLTQNHVMLEVRNGGNDCVLNTERGDDPWRCK